MSYTTSSQLEREARSKGDPITWRAYFQSLRDDSAIVRAKCYAILNENPEGAKQAALEKLVEKQGVWIEHDPQKRIFHVHGVMLRPKHELPEEPYTLSWAQDQITHTAPSGAQLPYAWCSVSHAREVFARNTHPSGLWLKVPTAPEYDATVRAITKSNQPSLALCLIEMMSLDYRHGGIVADRVTFGKQEKLIRPLPDGTDEEIPITLPLQSCSLRNIPNHKELIRAFLGTDELFPQVIRRYNALTYVRRITFDCPGPQSADRTSRAVKLTLVSPDEGSDSDNSNPPTHHAEPSPRTIPYEFEISCAQEHPHSFARGCHRSKMWKQEQ